MRPSDELLYDSEASLRLVDHAIEELNASGADLDRDEHAFIAQVSNQPGGFLDLSKTLLRAYTESVGIVARMRETQCVLETATMENLGQMHGKLSEVSSATEIATTDILNGLGRGVELVERIKELEGGAAGDRDELLASLREELYGVMVHLQFQDITAQQLQHIAALLAEMKERLSDLAHIFAPYAVKTAQVPQMPQTAREVPAGAFDPHATTSHASARQAIADEVFAVQSVRKTA